MAKNGIKCASIHDVSTGHILGSGCFNDVFEFLDIRDGDNKGCTKKESSISKRNSQSIRYVVKKLRRNLSKSGRNEGAIALARESKVLRKISHPNIVSIYCMGNNQGGTDFFIIIDRIDIDLAQQIQVWKGEESKLQLSKSTTKAEKAYRLESQLCDRINIAYQIASVLAYLHGDKILFRDLKPQNIGLNKDNSVKVFDFGLSKELSEKIKLKNDPGYDKYVATRNAGTPRYMAPEVFVGIAYGLPADIYSFSLVLWELMTLDISFDNMKTVSDLYLQAHEKKRRPNISGNWPKEIKRLLRKGWHHDPSKRPCAIDILEEIQLCMRRKIKQIAL